MIDVRISEHCTAKALAGGIDLDDIAAVYNDPDTVYPSLRYPHQEKRIGRGLCLAVDKRNGVVCTVFKDRIETDLRADQVDIDALAYGRRRR